MGLLGLTISEEKEVAALYQQKNSKGKRKYSQDELARHYGVAPVTIRRALAEQGVVELVGYKTRRESRLLKLLEEAGIHKPKDLEQLLYETQTA